jgi:hypothetical protein
VNGFFSLRHNNFKFTVKILNLFDDNIVELIVKL